MDAVGHSAAVEVHILEKQSKILQWRLSIPFSMQFEFSQYWTEIYIRFDMSYIVVDISLQLKDTILAATLWWTWQKLSQLINIRGVFSDAKVSYKILDQNMYICNICWKRFIFIGLAFCVSLTGIRTCDLKRAMITRSLNSLSGL